MSAEKQIRWKCRRGMLELDVILERFLQNGYAQLTSEQRADFERLLDEQDPTLYQWFLQRQVPEDNALKVMVEYILNKE